MIDDLTDMDENYTIRFHRYIFDILIYKITRSRSRDNNTFIAEVDVPVSLRAMDPIDRERIVIKIGNELERTWNSYYDPYHQIANISEELKYRLVRSSIF